LKRLRSVDVIRFTEPQMKWSVIAGDILDIRADVLICSANPFLNLSGGVGGALALRYGYEMQTFLHEWLAKTGKRWAAPGEVVTAPPCGTHYAAVVHVVGVDAFYESTVEIVRQAVAHALAEAARAAALHVALTAIATGYGHLSIRDFGTAIQPLLRQEWPPVEEIVIGIRHEDEVAELRTMLGL
jgi:O-acetyl-ADP-ribose deacetylase (regulator of RNase III)